MHHHTFIECWGLNPGALLTLESTLPSELRAQATKDTILTGAYHTAAHLLSQIPQTESSPCALYMQASLLRRNYANQAHVPQGRLLRVAQPLAHTKQTLGKAGGGLLAARDLVQEPSLSTVLSPSA